MDGMPWGGSCRKPLDPHTVHTELGVNKHLYGVQGCVSTGPVWVTRVTRDPAASEVRKSPLFKLGRDLRPDACQHPHSIQGE